jgi:hypothetical protein
MRIRKVVDIITINVIKLLFMNSSALYGCAVVVVRLGADAGIADFIRL